MIRMFVVSVVVFLPFFLACFLIFVDLGTILFSGFCHFFNGFLNFEPFESPLKI